MWHVARQQHFTLATMLVIVTFEIDTCIDGQEISTDLQAGLAHGLVGKFRRLINSGEDGTTTSEIHSNLVGGTLELIGECGSTNQHGVPSVDLGGVHVHLSATKVR